MRALAVNALDDVRNPNLFDLDLRLAKNVKLQRVNLVLAADEVNASRLRRLVVRPKRLARPRSAARVSSPLWGAVSKAVPAPRARPSSPRAARGGRGPIDAIVPALRS